MASSAMRPALVVGLIPLVLGPARPGQTSPANKDEGFVRLFDGKSLQGWQRFDNAGKPVPAEQSAFSVRDGAIYCSGRGRDYWLSPKGVYGNFVLRLQYKLSPGANSGIFLRVPGTARPAYTGFEVQILDDFGREPTKHTSGAIYDVLTPMRNMSRKAGEWNDVEITCKGSHVMVVWNGFKVIDADFAQLTEPIGKFDFAYAKMPRRGRIGVQNHGGELWFRNVRIKRLD